MVWAHPERNARKAKQSNSGAVMCLKVGAPNGSVKEKCFDEVWQ
jgi:hypothetical protein